MNSRFIITDLFAGIKSWLRSPGTVFWTILFPVLLIMIFGAIFSGIDEVKFDIVVQDLDETDTSQAFIKILEELNGENVTVTIDRIDKDMDIKEYLLDNDKSVALMIPEGFQAAIQTDSSINISFYFDPSDQTTTSNVRNLIANILHNYNLAQLQIKGIQVREIVGMEDVKTLDEDYSYIDFFIPGMIGFTIMTSMIYGSIERNTKYRKDGILRKLLTMPVTRAEWILSKMLFMLVLSFISTFVIMIVGIIVWGLHVQISIFFFILIISTSFLFSGMGMIIGRFVKEEETADMAGGAITFPMMFLAGTFFPLEQMPDFLQTVAKGLPLYYVNEGLRNAMIYSNYENTIFNTIIVLVFALIFFIMGVILTKWKED
jgi:ABC-2 type transport system permease protein